MLTRGNEFIAVNWRSLLDYTWNTRRKTLSNGIFRVYIFREFDIVITLVVSIDPKGTDSRFSNSPRTFSLRIDRKCTYVYSETKFFSNVAGRGGNGINLARSISSLLARSLKTFFLVEGEGGGIDTRTRFLPAIQRRDIVSSVSEYLFCA